MKRIKKIYEKKKAAKRPATPEMLLSTEDRLKLLANLMVDRIIEEEALYKERLKKDPNTKRIYETCECNKCRKKTINSAIAKGKLTCSRFRSR